ncbi:glycosyltransferase family 4 protein [Caldichromatium japonicum]|uniref:Glycosyltransferase family 4 protein n=1 Tax=Caldichromatium japonicum TaxID=2699430 RepID=A0A6G7VAR1_9GAMM|nr:glycosyltransferase family 4 protein [Caldichromatium japonicum]QIK36956.1 glycosyltransferase family 4 protein [Caldichromatium japonicum]
MKILFLSKRRPQGRDLFTQPYGRFFHLPQLLVERGHEAHLLLLGYRHEPAQTRCIDGLHVHTVPALPWGPWSYLAKAHALCTTFVPDWVVGFSDTWYGILATRLAAKHGCKSLIDAYDNYESYIPWARPLHSAWRRALARADVVTAAGPQLAEWMRITSGRDYVEVVPMAADPVFMPLPKAECRRALGLPLDRTLVGYSGSLHPNRGVDQLFSVYARLREYDPRIQLVLSGRLAKGVELPVGVHWLGYRPAEQVPQIVNSLDLMFVFNQPSAFGNYSYPAKLYEAMACGVSVVASNVPGTAWILQDHPEMLACAGDVEDFTNKAAALLAQKNRIYSQPAGWELAAQRFESLLGKR